MSEITIAESGRILSCADHTPTIEAKTMEAKQTQLHDESKSKNQD